MSTERETQKVGFSLPEPFISLRIISGGPGNERRLYSVAEGSLSEKCFSTVINKALKDYLLNALTLMNLPAVPFHRHTLQSLRFFKAQIVVFGSGV